MTLWHKFLVCFTWAAPGYIWGTTFFAFHGLFQRHCHCPSHQCLCRQHHWWPGVVSVPDVAGIFAGGSQSGSCSYHMQGDLAWAPPTPTDIWFPGAACATASWRPGLRAPPPVGLPGALGLWAQLPQPWAGMSITASAVPLAPLPPCEKSAHLQMYNGVYLWCPDVLGRKKKNFIYKWCYLQVVDWGEKQRECLLPP